MANTALTIWVRAAFAVFLLTYELVARWIEYCVLKASIKVRSCTFELTAIVMERSVYIARKLKDILAIICARNSFQDSMS